MQQLPSAPSPDTGEYSWEESTKSQDEQESISESAVEECEPETDTHDTQIWKRAKFNPYSTEREREDISSTKFVAQEKEENKMATVAQVTMTTIA